ncbi:MAG: hypothetical protein P1U34_08560 [Coxiellaceae bacterium]|nr:hypothetical protein [Coxiellaceae bacterium]
MARRSRAIRRKNRLQAEVAAQQAVYEASPEGRQATRASWMDQASRAARAQRLANPPEQSAPVSGGAEYQPTPSPSPVGAALEVGTRVGMGALMASLASKAAIKYLMEPSAHTHHSHSATSLHLAPTHHAQPMHLVTPTGHFTTAHFAAFSYVGVMMIGGWAYTLAQTAKSPNVNRHQLTNVAIQTGVATTIGTTVFGGFAKKALAAGGPIAFFAINAVMFAKSAFSAMQNHWHARKLRKNGKANSRAYKTYIAKRNQHATAASLHGIGAIGTGILITFAPVIALGWTIATAAASAGAQLFPLVARLFRKKKKPAQQQTNTVTNNTDHPREHVLQGARMTSRIAIQHVASEQQHHTHAVKAWSETHEQLHRNAGVRSYDLRHHYRHGLFHPVKDSVAPIAQPSPRDAVTMKARMLGVLQHAIDKAKEDLGNNPNYVKEGMLQRKLKLARTLYHSVREDAVTVNSVHQAVKTNKGNMLQLSALSSFRRRVGHMQSVVESVEYYAAWLDAHQQGKTEVDHSDLRYQHDDGYLIEAKCLQKHQPEAVTGDAPGDSPEEQQHLTPAMR